MKKLILITLMAFGIIISAQASKKTYYIQTQEEYDQFTVLNPDGDEDTKWTFDSKNEWATFNRPAYKVGDDYLISPPMHCEKGKSYEANFWTRASNGSVRQNYEIYAGTEPTVEGLNQILFMSDSKTQNDCMSSVSFNHRRGNFTAPETGTYYFAIKMTNSADDYKSNKIYCDEFTFETAVAYPGAAENVTAKRANYGYMEVEVSWDWPSTNDHNGLVDEWTGANIYRITDAISMIGKKIATVPGGKAGERATYTDKFTDNAKARQYYYVVRPMLDDKESTMSEDIADAGWVGYDSQIKPVTIAVEDEPESTWVTLEFSNLKGVHGGYVSDDDRYHRYRIYKFTDTFSSTDEPYHDDWRIRREGIFDTSYPFKDQSRAELNNYKYRVYVRPYPDGSYADYSETKTVYTGFYTEEPYSEHFLDKDKFKDQFLTLGKYEWKCSGNSGTEVIADPEGNNLLISPRFRLLPNQTYQVTLKAGLTWGSLAWDPTGVSESSVRTIKVYVRRYLCYSENYKRANSEMDYEQLVYTATLDKHLSESKTINFNITVPQDQPCYTLEFQAFAPEGADYYIPCIDYFKIAPLVGASYLYPVDEVSAFIAEGGDKVQIDFTPHQEEDEDEAADDASYLVVRMPDKQLIAANVKAGPVFDESIAGLPLDHYYYEVFSVKDNQVSRPCLSRELVLGESVELPYRADFGEPETCRTWTFLNNADGRGFEVSTENSMIFAENATDVWAITPPFKAEAGRHAVYMRGTAAPDAENSEILEIYLIPRPYGMDLSKIDRSVLEPYMKEQYLVREQDFLNEPYVCENRFTVEADGEYFLAYHLATPADQHNALYIRGSHVEVYNRESVGDNEEDGVEDIVVEKEQNDLKVFGDFLITDPGVEVEIYDINGALVLRKLSQGAIYLGELSKGIYIARAFESSLKFAR